jgi:hypothetical protein
MTCLRNGPFQRTHCEGRRIFASGGGARRQFHAMDPAVDAQAADRAPNRSARRRRAQSGMLQLPGVELWGPLALSRLKYHSRVAQALWRGEVRPGDRAEQVIAMSRPNRIHALGPFVEIDYYPTGDPRRDCINLEGTVLIAKEGRLIAAGSYGCTFQRQSTPLAPRRVVCGRRRLSEGTFADGSVDSGRSCDVQRSDPANAPRAADLSRSSLPLRTSDWLGPRPLSGALLTCLGRIDRSS